MLWTLQSSKQDIVGEATERPHGQLYFIPTECDTTELTDLV